MLTFSLTRAGGKSHIVRHPERLGALISHCGRELLGLAPAKENERGEYWGDLRLCTPCARVAKKEFHKQYAEGFFPYL